MRLTAHTQQASSARRGHVRLVAVDPRASSASRLLDQPPHALCGMPAGDPVRGLAPARSSAAPSTSGSATRPRPQRLPQVLVVRLGDRAPAVASRWSARGRQADPCGERPGVPETRELAGLEHEVGGRRGVDALEGSAGVDPPPPPGLAASASTSPLGARLSSAARLTARRRSRRAPPRRPSANLID